MKKIILTKDKVALVDDEDFERINQYKWQASQNLTSERIWYAKRVSKAISGKQKTIKMHREILKDTEGLQVDHINGNGLDNRKVNLRLCTNQQNHFNRKLPNKNNKLGVKGVYIEGVKFRARIKSNSKRINLGSFNVLGDADSAYRKAEEKYFGCYARNHQKV